MNLLNPEEQDNAFSKTFLASKTVQEMNLGYEDDFSYVGSSDSLLPNVLFANLVRNVGGSTEEETKVSCRINLFYER